MANKKIEFLYFQTLYQTRIYYDVNIKISDYSANSLVSSERKEFVRYLCVRDSRLSWTHHITYISTKISKSLGTLARLRHFVLSSTSLNIYRSLVQPYLPYSVFTHVASIYANLLEQKKAFA